MANIFPDQQPTTEEEKKAWSTSSQIDQEIKNVAASMLGGYQNIRNLIYKNPYYADPNDAYIAFQTYTKTGLSVEDLAKLAKSVKTLANLFQPGIIDDEVPEVVITF